MFNLPPRHAISRAKFFIKCAEDCTVHQRDEFEAYLEAAVVFGRTAIHHLIKQFSSHKDQGWKDWFESLWEYEAVSFFKEYRNHILKDGKNPVTQHIRFDSVNYAKELYSFEPGVFATETVLRHLETMLDIVVEAEEKFS